jgi:hypothetical protein
LVHHLESQCLADGNDELIRVALAISIFGQLNVSQTLL